MYEPVRYLPMRPRRNTPIDSMPPWPRRSRSTPRPRPHPREILDVATSEFAEHGFSGARVDEIAARTRTTKRMIYYYFGSKEGLFVAVLERAYADDPRARSRRSTSTTSTPSPRSAGSPS